MTKTLIEIKNKTDLIVELCKLFDTEIKLHYYCTECGREQNTYEFDFGYSEFENFINTNSFDDLGVACNKCGGMPELYAEEIFGIEVC